MSTQLRISRCWPLAGCLLWSMSCQSQAPKLPVQAPAVQPVSDDVFLTDAQVRAAELEIQAIVPTPAVSEVRAGGRIAFDDLRVAHVVSPVSGRVSEVLVSLGQAVKAGTPLARLHAPRMGAVLAEAAEAQADKVVAEHDFARQKALFAEHAVAQKDFEASANRLAQARATAVQAAQRRTTLGATAQDSTDAYILRAPIDGNVIARNLSPAAEVQGLADAGSDAPVLFTIGSLDTVCAQGEVFAIDAAAIRLQDPVQVQVSAYPQQAYPGHIDWLATSVERDSDTVRVRARLDNAAHQLKPEMTASLRIAIEQPSGLWVPARSVFQLGGAAFVFVATPHKGTKPAGVRFSRRRVVVAGASVDGRLRLSDGLLAGEQIVVRHGIFLTAQP